VPFIPTPWPGRCKVLHVHCGTTRPAPGSRRRSLNGQSTSHPSSMGTCLTGITVPSL
jgi:hypothetical protein